MGTGGIPPPLVWIDKLLGRNFAFDIRRFVKVGRFELFVFWLGCCWCCFWGDSGKGIAWADKGVPLTDVDWAEWNDEGWGGEVVEGTSGASCKLWRYEKIKLAYYSLWGEERREERKERTKQAAINFWPWLNWPNSSSFTIGLNLSVVKV